MTTNATITELLGLFGSCHSDLSTSLSPGALLDPTLNTLDPFLPNPLHSDITLSPSSQSTHTTSAVSPALTEEDERHIDNILYHGIDSPDLPPDLPPDPPPDLPPKVSSTRLPENSPDLALVQPQRIATPTPSNGSPLPSSSALFSPTTAYAAPSVSPPTLKRQFSLIEDPILSQDPIPSQEPILPQDPLTQDPPTPGPSTPRPTKRQCTAMSYPGESSFQLDPTIAPLQQIQPADQPTSKPRTQRADYSLCRCPGGLTSKPARHWRVCPYNPDRGAKPFACQICGIRFGRDDNRKRHLEDYH